MIETVFDPKLETAICLPSREYATEVGPIPTVTGVTLSSVVLIIETVFPGTEDVPKLATAICAPSGEYANELGCVPTFTILVLATGTVIVALLLNSLVGIIETVSDSKFATAIWVPSGEYVTEKSVLNDESLTVVTE